MAPREIELESLIDPITLLIAIIQYLVNTRITNARREEEMVEESIHQPELDDATLRVVQRNYY